MGGVIPAVVRLATTTSTQDEIHRLAAAGAPAGTAVASREQSAGRGARGRAWQAAAGGLWVSLLLRPVEPAAAALLSLRVGLRLAEVLEERTGVRGIGLKWPNDLVLAGRKLAGILCEARWHRDVPAWVAVGIGVNVSNPLPVDTRYGAIGLAELAPEAEAERLLEPVVDAIRSLPVDAPGLTPDEAARFDARDVLRGRRLEQPLAGVADGIAPDGALRVLTQAGLQLVHAGTVTPAMSDHSSTA